MNSLLIEKAKTSRSQCGVCKESIQEGEQRVGTQRWYPFKGFPCTTWHHRSCFDLPWTLSPGEIIPLSTNRSELYAVFVKAARLVISPSVREFLVLSKGRIYRREPYNNSTVLYVKNYLILNRTGTCTGKSELTKSLIRLIFSPVVTMQQRRRLHTWDHR